VASLIAIGGLGFTVYKALNDGGGEASAAVEAKQLVAFHQVTDRICAENQQALERALPEARLRVQLLAFISRGTGWGVNDLESVTAPASLAARFPEEASLRTDVQNAVLELQRADETGDRQSKADALAAIGAAESAATEVEHQLGLRRCAPVLPPRVRRTIGVD
jgi:hypothetical protein